MDLIKFSHSGSGKTVTIHSTPDDEENLTKNLTLITVPVSTQAQSTGSTASTTKILDLLMKCERRITIKGYLITGTVSGDTSSTASGRKEDLKTIFLAGGVCSMTYESSTFNVNMEKLSIKREPTDAITIADGEVEFSVQLTLVRGDNL